MLDVLLQGALASRQLLNVRCVDDPDGTVDFVVVLPPQVGDLPSRSYMVMRYFSDLQFDGHGYPNGWNRQRGQVVRQDLLDRGLSSVRQANEHEGKLPLSVCALQ